VAGLAGDGLGSGLLIGQDGVFALGDPGFGAASARFQAAQAAVQAAAKAASVTP